MNGFARLRRSVHDFRVRVARIFSIKTAKRGLEAFGVAGLKRKTHDGVIAKLDYGDKIDSAKGRGGALRRPDTAARCPYHRKIKNENSDFEHADARGIPAAIV